MRCRGLVGDVRGNLYVSSLPHFGRAGIMAKPWDFFDGGDPDMEPIELPWAGGDRPFSPVDADDFDWEAYEDGEDD